MNDHRKIAVCGGDERMLALTSTLSGAGYECAVWGMGKCDIDTRAVRVRDIADAVRECSALLLPLPSSRDSLTLSAPLHEGRAPRLSEIFELVPKEATIIGGAFSPSLKSELERLGLSYFDITERAAFAEKNAIPTVEGALAIAISETKKTLASSRVAVVGMGRIGKRLADSLAMLGASVTVLSRKKELFGYTSLHTSRVAELESGYDIIFNTAPARVFSKEFLAVLDRNCIIIDLASAPYGADRAHADAAGVKYIVAPGLPGRFSPESAGTIMGECALDILSLRGILP